MWTGSEMIVWGGWNAGPTYFNTGCRYDPIMDSWVPTSTGANVPAGRWGHTAVWTGKEMIVWGGQGTSYFDTGGRYDPQVDSWQPTSTGANVPAARYDHTAVLAGTQMIVWGGAYLDDLDTGALYCVDDRERVDYVLGQGLGSPNPNEVEIATVAGLPAIDFFAYSSGQWGVNVAGADIELARYQGLLTGPGPGAVFGPHVRAFRRAGTPIARVSFYAYGTLRDGVNVASGSTDSDAYDEIVTGAGPGGVFGPHVRGFNYDDSMLTAIAKSSFFAYGTLKYGVNVASADVDCDSYDELITGAGPGPAFASSVRGFDVDGGSVTAIGRINAMPFSYTGYGANVAAGDFDGDPYAEMAATPGPGPAHPTRFLGMNYDNASVAPIPGFDTTPFPTFYGGRVGAGDVERRGRDALLCGSGRDPSAAASVLAFVYSGTLVPVPGTPFDPFPGQTYGVNVAASATGY